MSNQLPKGWSFASVESLAELLRGISYKKEQARNAPDIGLKPILRANNINGDLNFESLVYVPEELISENQLVQKHDIVFAMSSGSKHLVGKSARAINDFDGSCGAFCGLVRPSDFLCKPYLYYAFQENTFKSLISQVAKGSNINNLKREHILLFEVPLPPLNEQTRIVAKIEELFSELDNGIAALKTARAQLKVYRQAVLKHAFEGKVTAKWREENADKLESPEQLLERIQQEREARYQQQLAEWKAAVKAWEANGKEGKKPGKPSKPTRIAQATNEDLPELPVGWVWVEYVGICEQIRNGISAKPSGDSGDKIFRISAVRAMEFNLDDIRYLQDPEGQYHDYFLSKGDLVFTRYNGTRDYVGVCAEYKGDGTHLYPDKLIQTRIGVASVLPSYLEKAINSGGSRKFMEKRIRTTAGQSGISGSDVKQMPVPICCRDEQAIIELNLERQLSNIKAIGEEIEAGLSRSETLRQSILKKAFSGQLVPQDPNDEPASELLARIQNEREASKAKSTIKTRKAK